MTTTTDDLLLTVRLTVEQIDILRGLVDPINKAEKWNDTWRKMHDPEGIRYFVMLAIVGNILLQARMAVEDN